MQYQGMSGQIYILKDQRLAGGGEGNIFEIVHSPHLVAKVFKADKRNTERENKIRMMVRQGASMTPLKQIAWPLDAIYDANGFAGYVMVKIENAKSLTHIYTSDEYDLRYRLLVATNLCIAVDEIHSIGQVCGDLNPQNICVNINKNDRENGFKITLVDTDSYHFMTAEKIYRCEVGLAEYLAPEIQNKLIAGRTLRNAPLPTYTQSTDLFAMAIHIFCLLMNGCHPFACAVAKNGASDVAPQPAENIKKGYFPFYDHCDHMTAPLYAPDFAFLPTELQRLFVQTFVEGYQHPARRVSAATWIQALRQAATSIRQCNQNHFYMHVPEGCPFCDMQDRMHAYYNRIMQKKPEYQEPPHQVHHEPRANAPQYNAPQYAYQAGGSVQKCQTQKPQNRHHIKLDMYGEVNYVRVCIIAVVLVVVSIAIYIIALKCMIGW